MSGSRLGTIRKDSDSADGAREAFHEAIEQDHRCWPAWEGLAGLVDVLHAVGFAALLGIGIDGDWFLDAN